MTTIEPSKILDNFMVNLPMKDYKSVQKKICEACFVTRQVFYGWRKGRRIPKLYQMQIEKVIGEKIFSQCK